MRNVTLAQPRTSFDLWPEQLRLHVLETPAVRALPRVERVARQGTVLHPSPLADQQDVLSLNLARGCAHRCAFCSVRAQPNYPGDQRLLLFTDTAERLAEELAECRKPPRAVYISPSTDPFPPLAEVQEEAARAVEVLAAHRVEAWLMTRGFMRPAVLQRLAACREHVKVTVGLTTLNRALQRILEPFAAPPRLRLRQVARLRQLGVAVQVALEPLVPGLTDTRANLTTLLDALAGIGVRHVTTGYLFLRAGIAENLTRALEPDGWGEPVLQAFEGGPVLSSGVIAAARYLPKARRQQGYAALMALGSERGMTVSVSRTTNPDFQTSRQPASPPVPRQRLLPQFEMR